MKLRDLFVRIGFDVNDKPIKRLETGIKTLIYSITAIGGAVIGAGTSLFALAKLTANAGDRAKKMSQSLGLTTEALQELEYAAKIGGVEQREFTTAIRQLSNSANDASLGLETYKRAYDFLGISVIGTEGKLKNTDIILAEVADKFKSMEDGAKKTAIANDLFGRSGAALIPLLNEGAAGIAKLRTEALEAGKVISDKDARASEEFNDSLTRLFAAIVGIRNQVGVGLIPVLTELITDIKKWILANKELIRSTLQNWIKRTVALLKMAYIFTKSLINGTLALIEAFGGLERVIKYVTFALAALAGGAILYGIGSIAMGIAGLTTQFISLGVAAIAAKVAVLALPLLIGVAIAALGLVIEDIIAYFKGKDSITGLIVEAFKKKYPEAIEYTKKALQDVKTLFKEVNDLIRSPSKTAESISAQVGRATGTIPPPPGAGLWENLKYHLSNIQFGHTNIPKSKYTGNGVPTVHAPVNLTVNVNGGNVGPTEVNSIRDGIRADIQSVFDGILRKTYKDTSPQVEY